MEKIALAILGLVAVAAYLQVNGHPEPGLLWLGVFIIVLSLI